MWYVVKGQLYLHINVSDGGITWVPITALATEFHTYIDAQTAADTYGGVPKSFSD